MTFFLLYDVSQFVEVPVYDSLRCQQLQLLTNTVEVTETLQRLFILVVQNSLDTAFPAQSSVAGVLLPVDKL